MLARVFAERDIELVTGRRIASIEPGRGVAALDDGSELAFDLFLGVPKHRAPDVVLASGIAQDGYVPVDSATLKTRVPHVYAIGDVATAGVPKAGVFSESAARTVAEQLLHELAGGPPPGAYPGTLAGDTYQLTDAANGSRLHTNLLAADTCAGVGVGTFHVSRAGGALRFRLVSDPCPARAALLTGRLWTPARPGASCVNNGGGACLGDLAAGSYRTRQFRPTVHYTVPAGWTNPQDLPGNLLLQPAGGDERFVGIYRNVTVPDGCMARADPAVGTSVDAILTWLVDHPGLQTSAPVPVSVGGLTGIRLDVSLAPDWRTTCPFSTGRPIVAILYGAGPSVLHHTLLPGFAERLYLLRLDAAPGKTGAAGTGTGNLVIEVGPEGRSLPELVQAAQPLLSSIRFGSSR